MSTFAGRTARWMHGRFRAQLNEKTRPGASCRSWIEIMNITSNSQISDRTAPPTFSSIARQPRHASFSSGIARGDAARWLSLQATGLRLLMQALSGLDHAVPDAAQTKQ